MGRTGLAAVAAIGLLLSGCREVAQMRAPGYCRYTESGPLCDGFDVSAAPYTTALGLRPLDIVHADDRPLVRAFAATLSPAPASIRVLAPVGDAPAGRDDFDRRMPQPFPRIGNPRLLILALGRGGGRVDLHSLILVEDRIAAHQPLAAGLRAAGLHGVAANGRFLLGFSLADRPGSLGDLYRLRPRAPQPDSVPVEEWASNLAWTRIPADSLERKLDYFRSIVNPGSCAGTGAHRALLLAPVPPAWIEEYERACPLHPERSWYTDDANRPLVIEGVTVDPAP